MWLRDHSRFRACEKAPQIGWSWVCAAEALWDCLLFEDAYTGFVSVSQREASEKIVYARKLYEGLPEIIQEWVPLVYDSTEELAFGDRNRPSRLGSFAATGSIRGRRMHVYIDEADFLKDGGRDAFRAGLSRTTRGPRLSIGSTCFGEDTILDEIMRGRGDKRFSRCRLPHTVATNPDVRESIALAEGILDEMDFAEEYGCVRGAGGGESFPADLVRACQHEQGFIPLDPRSEIPAVESAPQTILSLDVGGSRHPSVLNVWQRRGGPWIQAAIVEWRGVGLPEQTRRCDQLMEMLPEAILGIDANGIGLGPAQALENRWGSNRVIKIIPGSKPPDRPPQTRHDMATTLKRFLEDGSLKLLPDREQLQQLNRTRIRAGIKVDQPGTRKRDHYDRFWAAAFAAYVADTEGGRSVYEERDLIAVGGGREEDAYAAAGPARAMIRQELRKMIEQDRRIRVEPGEEQVAIAALRDLAEWWEAEGLTALSETAAEAALKIEADMVPA